MLIRSQKMRRLRNILIGLILKAIVLLRRKQSTLPFAIWRAVRTRLSPASQIRLRLSRRLLSMHLSAQRLSLTWLMQWFHTNQHPVQQNLLRSALRLSVIPSLHLLRRPDIMLPTRQGLASN